MLSCTCKSLLHNAINDDHIIVSQLSMNPIVVRNTFFNVTNVGDLIDYDLCLGLIVISTSSITGVTR